MKYEEPVMEIIEMESITYTMDVSGDNKHEGGIPYNLEWENDDLK